MQCLSFRDSAPTPSVAVASSLRTHELPSDPPLSQGTSTDGTPRSSSLVSPIDLTREYTLAVQTDSYNEIWTRIQEQVQVENVVENPDVNQLMLPQVLQPNRDCVKEALDQAKETTLTRLVSNYFDHSEDTTGLCLLLYQSVYRARTIYAPLHKLLDVFPDDPDDISESQCDWALGVFQKFDSFDNPFPCPDSHNFDEIKHCFSTLKHDLDRRLHKSRTRVRILHRAGAASVICLVGTVLGVAVSAAIISTHALAAVVVVTPCCFGYSPGDFRKKELSNMAQLEAAARGTYVLNNDLDTIDRLVSRLYTAVEGDKLLVQIGLERSRDKYPINEVVKQLRKNQANFIEQLVDLEEHICLCFNTVNKARSLLLQKVHLHRSFSA